MDGKISSLQSQHPLLTLRMKNLHFVFLELCARPDYADMIYGEIQSVKRLDYDSITNLPILDSFIKETARLNPLDKSQ